MSEVLFLKSWRPQPRILLKKRLWLRFFSCEVCEIFKNTFFTNTSGWPLLKIQHLQQINTLLKPHFYYNYFTGFISLERSINLFILQKQFKLGQEFLLTAGKYGQKSVVKSELTIWAKVNFFDKSKSTHKWSSWLIQIYFLNIVYIQ